MAAPHETPPPYPRSTPPASIVIRTYNEQKHLPHLLTLLGRQDYPDYEIVVVDSGSTDSTVEIAQLAGARIVSIEKEQFTFGRSLNYGCREARGELLAFISGHCYPADEQWLSRLLAPFADEMIGLTYGRQFGGETTKYSEHRHFAKTFPERSRIPQSTIFCNNANAAIRKSLWHQRPYNEALTGLEDLDWAKWLTGHGRQVAYVAEAAVQHLHEERWRQVRWRYEREALALKAILPDLRFGHLDFARLFVHSVWLDARHASREGVLFHNLRQIVMFRLMQYWGTLRGNRFHKTLSQEMKEHFFYPK